MSCRGLRYLCGNQIYGAFVLNRRVDLHAIDAMPARWRGDDGSSPLDGASAVASSPRNDLVKNYRVHPTHWLICAQISTITKYIDINAMTTLKDRTSAGVFWEMGVSSSDWLSTLSAVRVAS